MVLLVITGTGFFLFFPRDASGALSSGGEGGPGSGGTASAFDPVEWVREDGAEFPGLPDEERKPELSGEESDEFVIVYGEAKDEPIGERPPVVERSSEPAVSPGSDTGRTGPDKPSPDVRSTNQTSSRVEKDSRVEKEPERKTVTVTEYWIQAGSFQSRSGAEEANRILGEKGFSARLTTKDVDGTSYYRVRLGPYANREEAEKFLAWVKELDPFGTSYISQVRATKSVRVQ